MKHITAGDLVPFGTKLLIANRGEIAVRIFNTAKKLGFTVVSVFSDADRHSLHTEIADIALHIGESNPQKSYLDIDRIMRACEESGAEYLHPGYGFLSENADLAAACEKKGVNFIGPSSAVIKMMGDKQKARQAAESAGLTVLPAYFCADPADFNDFPDDRLYPFILKPVAGGGGKGMAVVNNRGELSEKLPDVHRQAIKNYLNGGILIEKYLPAPRHVEVQVIADGKGGVAVIGDRDCSLQRRYQKIIEEAPAPNITEEKRLELHRGCETFTRSINYKNAGTLEFLYDDNRFYFMEMNTRIQVEHPVTEEVFGMDLIAVQLNIAVHGGMPAKIGEPCCHAVEARLYSEDPAVDFRPQTGTVKKLNVPSDIRADFGIREKDEITPFYDPMIGKIIAVGNSRTNAVHGLNRALSQMVITGVRTNVDFLSMLCLNDDFANAQHHIHTAETAGKNFSQKYNGIPIEVFAAAALFVCGDKTHSPNPWKTLTGWRLNTASEFTVAFSDREGKPVRVTATRFGDELILNHGNRRYSFGIIRGSIGFILTSDNNRYHIETFYWHKPDLVLAVNSRRFTLELAQDAVSAHSGDKVDAQGLSPASGNVIKCLFKNGDQVKNGDSVVIIESMKMEISVHAHKEGTVSNLHIQEGQKVTEGQLLFEIEIEAGKGQPVRPEIK